MVANINAINFRISSDVSGLSAGVKLTRTEINRLNSIQRQAVTDSDKLVSQINTMTKGLAIGAIDAGAFAKSMEAAQKKILPTATEAQRLEQALLVVQSALKGGAIDSKTAADATAALRQKYSETAAEAKRMAEAQQIATREAQAQAEAAARRSRVASLVGREIGDATRLAMQIRDLRKEYEAGNLSAGLFARANQSLRQKYADARAAAASLAEGTRNVGTQSQEAAARLSRVNAIVSKQIPETTRLAIQIRELRKEYEAGNVSSAMFARSNENLRQKYEQARAAAAAMTEEGRRQSAQADALAQRQSRVAAIVASQVPEITRLRNQLRELTAEYRIGNVTSHQFSQASSALRAKMAELKGQATETTAAFSGFGGQVKALVGAYVGFQAVTSTFQKSMQFSDASIQFEVLTGSIEEGRRLLQDMKTLAAATPLEFVGVTETTRLLLSFGIETDKVIGYVKQLGDISGGNADKMNRLAVVLGQVSQQTYVTGGDILQFVNAGFNPLNVIAQQTGETMKELKKRVSEGGVSFEEIANAINIATSKGGLFFGMMDKMSTTLTGAIAKLSDEVTSLQVQVGQALEPAVIVAVDAMRSMVETVRNFTFGISEGTLKTTVFLGTLAGSLVVIPNIIAAIRSIVTAYRAWIASQITITALTGPAGWAILAGSLAAAAAAVYATDEALTAYEASAQRAAEANQSVATTAKDGARSMAEILKIEKERTQPAQDYIDQLREQNLELAMGADWVREFKAIQGLTPEQREELEFLKARNKELLAAKKNQEAVAEARQKAIEDRQQQVDELRQAGVKFAESLQTPLQELTAKLTEIEIARRRGELSSNDAMLASRAAKDQFSNQQKPIKVELPPVAQRGSRQEYQVISQIFSGERSRREQMHRENVEIARAQLQAQRDAVNAIANMPVTGAV